MRRKRAVKPTQWIRFLMATRQRVVLRTVALTNGLGPFLAARMCPVTKKYRGRRTSEFGRSLAQAVTLRSRSRTRQGKEVVV